MNRKTYSSSSTNRMISVYGTIAEESSFEVLMPFVPKEYTVVGKAPPHCLTILFARKRGICFQLIISQHPNSANSVNKAVSSWCRTANARKASPIINCRKMYFFSKDKYCV